MYLGLHPLYIFWKRAVRRPNPKPKTNPNFLPPHKMAMAGGSMLLRQASSGTLRRVAADTIKWRPRRSLMSCVTKSSSSISIDKNDIDMMRPLCHRRKHHSSDQWRMLSSVPQRNDDEPDVTCNDVDEYIPDELSMEVHDSIAAPVDKEEKRRLHEQKYRLAQEKKESRRRGLSCTDWMSLFSSSQELFKATMKELNVDKGDWGSDGNGAASCEDSVLADYKSFYLDSLTSFGDAILEKDAETGISLDSFDSLDKFAESSFADAKFSSNYRSMISALKRKEELQSLLAKKAERHSNAIDMLKEEEEFLKQVKGDTLISKNNQDFDELSEIEVDVNTALLNIVKSDPKKISKQENKCMNAKQHVDALIKSMERIQEEIDGIIYPLTLQQYQEATTELLDISSDLIPDLAKYIIKRHSDFEKYQELEQHTDLTKPHEWYPRARLDKRKVIFHAGPTNSGKTYNALLRLKHANKGMYLAPLRLLAAECYENLTSEGVYCRQVCS